MRSSLLSNAGNLSKFFESRYKSRMVIFEFFTFTRLLPPFPLSPCHPCRRSRRELAHNPIFKSGFFQLTKLAGLTPYLLCHFSLSSLMAFFILINRCNPDIDRHQRKPEILKITLIQLLNFLWLNAVKSQ